MPPRRRPPWWPEGEDWPPPDGHWRHGRPGNVRRPFGCFFVLLVLAATGALTAGIWTLAAILGLVSAPPMVTVAGIAALGLVVLLGVGAARTIRATVGPIDDLVDAAARIESGDYSARVPERGTPPMRGLARAFNGMSARLADMDTERRAFLADVAHELRTPLSVIEAQLAAIEDGVYPPDAAHLAPIHEQVRALERLIDDLRTVALAEAGALALVREPTDLADLADESVAAFRTPEVTIDVAADHGLPLVSVDPARVRQILANLLSNAVRHTPPGGSVRVVLDRDGEWAVVSVVDSGSGIAPELLPRVFDRFAKGLGSSGSGLGLAIARDLVEAHGGQITAASTPAEGTTIRFTLPLA
jgi:two-component system sensor histidine kinase BaeS